MRIRRRTALVIVVIIVAFMATANNWSRLKPGVAGALNTLTSNEIHSPASRLEAGASILIDEQTGEVLFAKNEQLRMYPASTTKIMTAWIAIEQGELQDVITVGDEVHQRTSQESSAGLVKGQIISLQDLLAALMLPSGNDAARTIARYIAEKKSGKPMSAEDSTHYFAKLMNQQAAKAGAKQTHFVNPHGLHDAKHYTTASDMAIIARQAMKNSVFNEIVSQPKISIETNLDTLTYVNRNLLLKEQSPFFFKGANGVKSGFTDEAGYCLVSSASRDGEDVLAVVLNSSEDRVWADSQELLELGFEAVNNRQ